MTEYTILRVDGAREDGLVDWPRDPGYAKIAALVDPILGGHLEHVNVFHDNGYTDMFVDEVGKLKGLPRNEDATKIYRNNVLVHEPQRYPDPEVMPAIYGTAILFHRKIWY